MNKLERVIELLAEFGRQQMERESQAESDQARPQAAGDSTKDNKKKK